MENMASDEEFQGGLNKAMEESLELRVALESAKDTSPVSGGEANCKRAFMRVPRVHQPMTQ